MIQKASLLLFGLATTVAPQTALAADAAAGKAKAAICTTCHGADGLSQLPNAPHIAGQPEVYLAAQLRAYRDGTRSDPMMSVIAQPLTDTEIEDLAAWFSSIQVTATVPE